MPPTRRTIGMPSSRNTTSAERGLPGSPMTGTPPQSARSVGLPGRSAMPCAQMPGSPSPATAAAVSSRAPTEEPADTTTTSLGRDRVAQRPRPAPRGRRARSRARSGSPPASRASAASAGAVASRTWPALELGGRRVDDLVAGRHDRHPRAGVDAHLGHARRREQPEVLRAQWAARAGPARRPRGVLVGAHQAVAGRDGPHDLDRPRHRLLRVLDHHDRVGAGGDSPPVGIATALPADRDDPGARPITTAPMTSR